MRGNDIERRPRQGDPRWNPGKQKSGVICWAKVEIHAIPSALADRAQAGGLNGGRGMTDALEAGSNTTSEVSG